MIAIGCFLAMLASGLSEPPAADARTLGTPTADAALERAYEDRLRTLRDLRVRLESGEDLSAEEVAALLREPADQERRALAFERRYLAALERVIREREALRREREAAANARPEGPDAGTPEEESGTAEAVTPAAVEPGIPKPPRLDEAEIRESLEPGALADLLYDLERYEEALVAYDAVPATAGVPDARTQWVLYRKGQCLFETGRTDEALATLGRGLDEVPEGPWTDLCRIAMDAIELDRAIARGLRSDSKSDGEDDAAERDAAERDAADDDAAADDAVPPAEPPATEEGR